MADEIITRKELVEAKVDAKDLGECVHGNATGIVNPRLGNPYPTLPAAVKKVMETGGFEPFLTEVQLKASIPTVSPKAAKALDTKKIWYWDGAWHDTGLSELDQAKGFADGNALFKPVRLTGNRPRTDILEPGYFHVIATDVATQIGMPEASTGFLLSTGRSAVTDGNCYHTFTTSSGNVYVSTFLASTAQWGKWVKSEDFKALEDAPDLNKSLEEGFTYIAGALYPTPEKGYPFKKAGFLLRRKNSSNYYNQTYITEDGFAVRYGALNATTGVVEFGAWRGVKFTVGITDLSVISTLTPLLTAPIIKPVRLDGTRHHEVITEVGHFHVPTAAVATQIGMPEATFGMLFSSGYSWNSVAGNIYHIFTTNTGNIYVNTFDSPAGNVWTGWKSKTQSTELKVAQNTIDIANLKENGFTDKLSKAIERGQVYQTKTGVIKDTANRYDYFSCWGSSTIELMQDKLKTMANSYGILNTTLEGKGSEIAETIGARFGSFKLIVKPVTIPASGYVNISTNLPAVSNIWYIKRFKVNFAGIVGDIYWKDTSLVFERDLAGDSLTLNSDTTVTPIFDQKFRDGILILNIGKNNLTSDDVTINTALNTFNHTVKFIDYIRSVFKKIIILDQYVDINTAAEAPVRARIKEFNRLMKEKYGESVLNVYEYLIDQAFIDGGYTKTPADIQQIALGNLPNTWSRDTWHMNSAAEDLIIEHLIKPKLSSLGWV